MLWRSSTPGLMNSQRIFYMYLFAFLSLFFLIPTDLHLFHSSPFFPSRTQLVIILKAAYQQKAKFTISRQLLYLNRRQGENGSRNYFMTKSLRKICGRTEDQTHGLLHQLHSTSNCPTGPTELINNPTVWQSFKNVFVEQNIIIFLLI